MIINICAIVIGLLIMGAGIYYLMKSKDDAEAKKIYAITTAIGAVMSVIAVIVLVVR